jgi:hypothetical protein
VENLALAEAGAVVTGHCAPGQGNWSLASEGQCCFDVCLVSLDDYLDRHPLSRLDAVKIDVEGAEVRVLRGARRTVERFRPVIVFEVCPMWLARSGTSVEELFSVVEEPGYTIHELPATGQGRGRLVDLDEMRRLPAEGWCNLMAVPRD